jgi:hypothetical protein
LNQWKELAIDVVHPLNNNFSKKTHYAIICTSFRCNSIGVL